MEELVLFTIYGKKWHCYNCWKQSIQFFQDIGRNPNYGKKNTEVPYLTRLIESYEFTFNRTGKTLTKCYYKDIRITHDNRGKTISETIKDETIDERTMAKILYKKYMARLTEEQRKELNYQELIIQGGKQ